MVSYDVASTIHQSLSLPPRSQRVRGGARRVDAELRHALVAAPAAAGVALGNAQTHVGQAPLLQVVAQ
jgi:hypothetical protein